MDDLGVPVFQETTKCELTTTRYRQRLPHLHPFAPALHGRDPKGESIAATWISTILARNKFITKQRLQGI